MKQFIDFTGIAKLWKKKIAADIEMPIGRGRAQQLL